MLIARSFRSTVHSSLIRIFSDLIGMKRGNIAIFCVSLCIYLGTSASMLSAAPGQEPATTDVPQYAANAIAKTDLKVAAFGRVETGYTRNWLGTAYDTSYRNTEEKPAAFGIYAISRGTLYAGAGLDLATTLRGYRLKREETNALISKVPGNRYVATSAVVGGTAVAASIATAFLRTHGHPKLAVITNFCVGGLHAYAGIRNLR